MSQSTPVIPTLPSLAISAASRGVRAWVLITIALLAAGVYFNSTFNGFAFDDTAIVRDNINVVDLQWTNIWHDNYWAKHDGIQPDSLYRPITIWSYLANQALTPGATWAFHLTNVLLHSLVSVLVVLLVWRILGEQKIAILTGVLFAVHPLHAEAVANTVGRAELLATCWSLLTLLVYLPAVPLGSDDRPVYRSRWHGLLVSVCFFTAILCKETPATLLPAFVVIDLWRWTQWSREQRPTLFRWLLAQFSRYYLPLGTVFGIYLVLRIHACGLMTDARAIHPIVNLLVEASIPERIVTPFALLAKYLSLSLWPVHLSADYSAPSILPTANPLRPDAALGILTCALTMILMVRTWKKIPKITLIVVLFALSYFLVSNIIRIGTIFGERLFYWPSVFELMLLAWGMVRAYEWAGRQKAAVAAAIGDSNVQFGRMATAIRLAGLPLLIGSVVAMSYRTIVRNTDWKDDITLAIATGRDNPSSAKACAWAGAVLVVANDTPYSDLGRELLLRSVELYPDSPGAIWDLAKYYGRKNELGNSLIYLARAVRGDAGTHNTFQAIKGITDDLRRAPPASYMPIVEENLKQHPKEPEAYFALALALHGQSKWEEAENAAVQALVLAQKQADDHPELAHAAARGSFHEAAAEMAKINFESGKVVEGVAMYYKYAEKMKHSVDAQCTYAEMLLSLDHGKYVDNFEKAEDHLRKAEVLEAGNLQVRKVRAELSRAQMSWNSHRTQSASAMPHDGPGVDPSAVLHAGNSAAPKGTGAAHDAGGNAP